MKSISAKLGKLPRFLQQLILIASIALSPLAWAIDLQSAKSQGLVGETANGYLEVVKPKSAPEIHRLVNDVNGKRRQKYQAIATKNKISLQAVEARAGERAIAKTKAGQFIKPAGSSWKKK
ncbi:YdbL family protein [Pseudomaricurvus alkylphenolicus]|nr:YdbL family protein [Pseudomaricurvus alkylphenolicus]